MFETTDLYRGLLDALHEGVCLIGTDRRVVGWNRGAESLLGFTDREAVGGECWRDVLVHHDESGRRVEGEGGDGPEGVFDAGRTWELEAWLRHREGHLLPAVIRVVPIRDSDGRVVGAAELFMDNTPLVTERRRTEALARLSLLDPLTGAGNRRFAEMKLHTRFNEMRRYGWDFGLLLVEVDQFAWLLERYGPGVGDAVIKMAVRTLNGGVRALDDVARWEGGGVFAVIAVNIGKNRLAAIAERLRQSMEQAHLILDDDVLRVTVSVGAALGRVDDTVDALVGRAGGLLSCSRQDGGNRITVTLGG